MSLLALGSYSGYKAFAHSNGQNMGGSTNKPGSTYSGCTCHCATPSANTTVALSTTATSFAPSTSYTFTVTISNSTESAAGVQVAVYSGALTAGTGMQSINGELTHTSAKTLSGGSASFTFTYTTPSSAGYDTLYASGNAVNSDNTDDCNDQWNRATKYVVHVVSTSLTKSIGVSRPSVAMGSIRVGRRKADSLTVSSLGTGSLTITSSAMKSGAYFSSYPTGSNRSLATGTTEIDSVIFTPTSRGAFTDSLIINDNADAAADQRKAVYVTGTATQAIFTGGAGPIAFGNLRTGRTAKLTYTYQNTGDDSLFLSTPSISGSGFTISSQPSRLNLASGERDSVVVQFAPTLKQAYSGTLTLTPQPGLSATALTLSGTGVAPQIQYSSTGGIGGIRLGQSIQGTVNIRNAGSDTLHITNATLLQNGTKFTLSGYDQVILPLTSGVFRLSYSPTIEKIDSATLQFTTDDPANNSPSVLITASGILPHMAILDHDTVDFGSVKVGQNTTHDFAILNNGTDALTIYNATVSTNPPFSLIAKPADVQASSRGFVTVQFQPQSVGNFSGQVIVTGDDPSNSADTIFFKGSGNNSALSIPGNLDFGGVNVSASGSKTITMQNAGGAAVTIKSYKLVQTGTVFSISDTSAHSVAGNGSATVGLKFTPPDAQQYTATLQITTDDATTPLRTVTLSGKGLRGALSISQSGLEFGTVDTGSRSMLPVSIKNTGSATASISGVNLNGSAFTFAGATLPLTLAAGDSTIFDVRFNPSTAGDLTGTLTFTTSDKPIAVALHGVGRITQSGVASQSAQSEISLRLTPNPARNTTIVRMMVVTPGEYTIALYDESGRSVSSSATGRLTTGEFDYNLNASSLPSGNYFVRVSDEQGRSIEGRLSIEH